MPVLRCRTAPQLIAFRRIHQPLGPIMTQKNRMPANRQNMASASMPTAGPFPFHGLIGAVVIRHDIPRNRLPHHNIPWQKPIPRKRNPLPEPGHRPIHHIRRQLLPPSVNPPIRRTAIHPPFLRQIRPKLPAGITNQTFRLRQNAVGQLIQPSPPRQQSAAVPIRSRQTPPKISRIQLKSDPKLPRVIQANRAPGLSLRPR